ncbi:hypothetical protein H4O14_02260 [Bacillus sp. PAMC26568]|nr:hypothetical protein H4O14_02260 [Bacillus sp. PAMC26568]
MAVFNMPVEVYRELKRHGVTDEKIAKVNGLSVRGINNWKYRRGIKGKISKLSDNDITLIRQLYFSNQGNLRELGAQFNISTSYVSDLVNGRRKRTVEV